MRTRDSLCSCCTLLLQILLLVIVACSSHVSAKDGDKAEVSFVNYGDTPVKIYWYDGPNDEYVEIETVDPFEMTRIDSFLGHLFAYGPRKLEYSVTQEASVHKIGNENDDRVEQNWFVLCGTTQGDLHITVKPHWSPLGAARFLELVTKQYFDGCALNRVVPHFLTQFGISGDYQMRTDYRSRTIPDDPFVNVPPFRPGYMAYAGSGPNSRSTEMFIVMPHTPPHQLKAFGKNPWETPFGYVNPEDIHMVVSKWYGDYGDMPPWGNGPDPQRVYQKDGYDYLQSEFPKMDYIQMCQIVQEEDPNWKKRSNLKVPLQINRTLLGMMKQQGEGEGEEL